MSVIVQVSLEEAIFLSVTGHEVLWTQADVEEHYRKKRMAQLEATKRTEKLIEEAKKKTTTYQTKFVDKDLLKQALENTNTAYSEKEGKLCCSIPNNDIEIFRNTQGNFDLHIKGDCNKDTIQVFYNKIGKAYEAILQERVCSNIKSKIASNPTMQIIQEEVLEDNSVVITINV